MPVIRVYSPHSSRISQRYYCLYCWGYLADRASVEIPDLIQSTGEQDAQHIGVLLGITPGVKESGRVTTVEGYIDTMNAALDMTIKFPVHMLVGRVPFERWYPKGDDLTAHVAEAKKRLGHDAS